MSSFGERLQRGLALLLVVLLAAPLGSAAQQTAPPTQGGTASSSQSAPQAPAAQPSSSASQPANTNPQTGNQAPAPQQNGNTAPVGTAVAPYEKGVGVAASRPAGVVIAPAKQRRTRSFAIKVALVVGAAVAVGTVIGLSKATPSAPAH